MIDKPAGMTSFGVVARVRRILTSQENARRSARGEAVVKRVKVGHTGTLDPFATGLLILLTGKMTRESDKFLKLDKVYLATLRLGATSTTGDPEGEVSEVAGVAESPRAEIAQALQQFVGKIKQTPPIYSAIKIDGRRAYDLARRGETPKMPEREVEIYDIELIDYAYPKLVIRVHCSSGTYIRTLAEDIGKKLGCGAYLTELRREKVGDYSVEDAEPLESFMAREA